MFAQVDFYDGFNSFEAVLPRDDEADGGADLRGELFAVDSAGENGEGVHGFIHAEAFDVGPIEYAAVLVGPLFWIEECLEGDMFGAAEGRNAVEEAGVGITVAGGDHGPGFDAAHAVDAFFGAGDFEEVGEIEDLWFAT